MKPLDDILSRASRHPKHIVLPEGDDPRIAQGALRAQRQGIAQITLLGRHDAVETTLSKLGGVGEVQIADPATAPVAEEYAALYQEVRAHKGVDIHAARAAMARPLDFAAMMVRRGDADGTLGGAVAATADVVRAALQIIGPAPGTKTVSSFFLMMLCEHHHTKKGGFIFADCGLIVEPTVSQLTDIALASADSFADLVGEEPRVAMLSFSTGGSASHERVSHVVEAARRVASERPDLRIEGDIQFDAAFVPAIGAAKAPDSAVGGEANVLVFPNLDAANIGYKIAQRIGGAKALGPVLQGLARPANDLSRGCDAEDVFHMIAMTVSQTIGSGT